MRLRIRGTGDDVTVALAIDDPKATVADLRDALGLADAHVLHRAGRPLGADDLLADTGLVDGERLTLDGEVPEPVETDSVLAVVSGADSGRLVARVSDGSITIGRGDHNDLRIDSPTVSDSHTVVASERGQVTVRDLGSHNGTWIDGELAVAETAVGDGDRIRLGASTVRVVPWTRSDRAMGAGAAAADGRGRILLNRPPRRPRPSAPAPVQAPEKPAEGDGPSFSLVAFVVPIVFAGVMVAVMGSWRYALFALLSPVMLVGNYVSGRRRAGRDRAGAARTWRAALDGFGASLDEAALEERTFRQSRVLDGPELRRRVGLPSSLLWERRLDADDAMTVGLGRGDVPWDPPVTTEGSRSIAPEVEQEIAARRTLSDLPILADLRAGPVGLVGEPSAVRAVARTTMAQLAVAHGPADLSFVVLTEEQRLAEWRWAQLLPHLESDDGGVRVLAGEAASVYCRSLEETLAADGRVVVLAPAVLVVVDDVELLHGRGSPARRLLERSDRNVYGLVLVDEDEQLPASTSVVARLEDVLGTMTVTDAIGGRPLGAGTADMISVDIAAELAAGMARFEDPEQSLGGQALPPAVDFVELTGPLDPGEIGRRWTNAPPGLVTGLGIGIDGPVDIDLVADGPHALVAGTTGAGKSEFLRSLVVGLAVNYSPDDLVFVLIDYKGGSAFDACARLPHVVGMVTDLDEHLAERALRSLEAELRHRERLLRNVAAGDLDEYRRAASPSGPLPRLVVIIDEFATLRSELPDFVASLVGIAQRGRSLGVHLVLATQRPSGAVDANIRANTNLRVALRVQDSGDSTDVIDEGGAAQIARDRPGRAFLRRGAGDLVAVQTGYVSGARRSGADKRLRIAPIELGAGRPPRFPTSPSEGEESQLEHLVGCVEAAALDVSEPRRPWLPDLPERLGTDSYVGLASSDGADLVLAVVDEPDRQRRVTAGWEPAEGHLAVFASLGRGATTLLRSLIIALGDQDRERPSWVYVADHGAGGLAGVERLPHVGARLDEQEVDRHRRLLTMLDALVDSRRADPGSIAEEPLVVLVVDGLAGFLDGAEAGSGDVNADLFGRIVRDGPAVGVVMALSATTSRDIPRPLHGLLRRQFVMGLSDPSEYSALGVRSRSMPVMRPGRVLVGPEPMVGQVIDRPIVSGASGAADGPPAVELLPETIPVADLEGSVDLEPHLGIPVGLDDLTRTASFLPLRRGEHAVIAGPPGSGKTTALRLIGAQLRRADETLVLVGLAPREAESTFADLGFDALGTADELRPVLEAALTDERRWVLLIDDADQLDDPGDRLNALASSGRPGLSIVAGLRSSSVRQAYGHWTRHVRSAGVGVLLQPDNAVDGEVLGVRLPRHERLPVLPGRGYLVHGGQARVVQLAC